MKTKKRIVICCDGTWNEPDQNPTNVIKIAHHLAPVDKNGIQQVVFYDQGVGTGGAVDKFIGGATGKGIEKNVLDGYRFIIHNYDPQDEIYLFGFSRGAYTARAIAGMINAIGLLPKDHWEKLPQAYQYYRTEPAKRNTRLYQDNHRPDIQMIGVWDTVGALGVPTPGLRQLSKSLVSFFDTEISPLVRHAYHALALDEKRGPFAPSIWTGDLAANQVVEQCWFAGVHSDIGGGYEDHRVSDLSLVWMVEKASQLGLEFDTQDPIWQASVTPSALAPLHDSYGKAHQLFGKVMDSPYIRQVQTPPGQGHLMQVHDSVFERMQASNYLPQSLKLPPQHLNGNRRQFDRFQTFATQARLALGGQQHNCTLENYSPGMGAAIKTNLQLQLNSLVDLLVGKQQLKLQCIWAADNRYGLRRI